MRLSDFDYQLPPERIAQTPVSPRDHSQLLIVNRNDGSMHDAHFYDLADLLTANDVLVLNNTKVFPARLHAEKQTPLGLKPIELLMEKEVKTKPNSITWEVLSKPGLKLDDHFFIPGTDIEGVCTQVNSYTRTVELNISREAFFALLFEKATTPIPPYIHWNEDDEQLLREKYQTVYAQRLGAVAAPTAGLHFTPGLLAKLHAKGVHIEYVTLHVGAGTFLPVKTDDIAHHHMHEEWFELTPYAVDRLNLAKKEGKRIIAVGTTTVRVLETCATPSLLPLTGPTSIFIYPPYKFQFVDSMITNFHTPKSTLLMLVSAFVSTPNTDTIFNTFMSSLIGKAYMHALEHGYRFYSFGDAMWIQ